MRTKSVEVRILAGVGHQLRRMLTRPTEGREPVAFAFASMSSMSRGLIIREVMDLPNEAFVEGRYGAEWSHRWTVQFAARAAQLGTGICILHRHHGQGQPRLSRVDGESLDDLASGIRQLFPTLPVASVVFSDTWEASGSAITADGHAIKV